MKPVTIVNAQGKFLWRWGTRGRVSWVTELPDATTFDAKMAARLAKAHRGAAIENYGTALERVVVDHRRSDYDHHEAAGDEVRARSTYDERDDRAGRD